MSKFTHRLTNRARWLDLVELVDAAECETETLEFKRELPNDERAEKANHTVRKDAVAMANAQGGVILYGVEENDEHRVARLCGVKEPMRVVNRLQSLLADTDRIDPPLRFSVVEFREGDGGAVVVGVRVHSDGHARGVSMSRDDTVEFWKRRDSSIRQMTVAEIARALSAPIQADRATTVPPQQNDDHAVRNHLTALAVWELRSLSSPRRDVFQEPEERALEDLLERGLRIVERSRKSSLADVELAWNWEEIFTGAIHRGGLFRNYREAARYFESLMSLSLRESDGDRTAPASVQFGRVVEFGRMLSYQGNRRLENADLVVALGAEVLGNAILFAERIHAQRASQEALHCLDEQAAYYTGALADCFTFARAIGLSRGSTRLATPPLAREAETTLGDEVVFTRRGRR